MVTGCSVKRFALNRAAPIMQDVVDSAFREPDYDLLKDGLPTALVILNALTDMAPDNGEMLILAAQGYFGYSLAFLDGTQDERASRFYTRGRDYGLKALRLNCDFAKALDTGEKLENAVRLLDKDDLPAIFWTANNWAAYVNINRRDPMVLFDFPKVKALMDRVMEINDKYYYGGAHLFFASYYATLPSMAGGGFDKAQVEFDKVFAICGGKFLIANLFYAQYFAMPQKNEELFNSQIKIILDTPSDIIPDLTFVNEVAKRKARALLEKKDQLF
jgi:hypothetical protein